MTSHSDWKPNPQTKGCYAVGIHPDDKAVAAFLRRIAAIQRYEENDADLQAADVWHGRYDGLEDTQR